MSNIIFDKIIINNFLSIGNAEVDLCEKGFILVSGKNKEASIVQSNGSGKSTIFDAIFWTLTGETLRGASDVVNEHRKSEGCMCELYFHTTENTYKIVRTKSHKDHGNTCQLFVDDIIVSDQTRKSQEMIEKTIPSVASPEILGSIILLGQGLPYKFTSFNPSKRKDLLETMSGSSTEISKVKYKLDAEEADHRRIIDECQAEVSRSKGIIEGLQSTITLITQQIASIKSPDQVIEETHQKQEEIVIMQSSLDKLKETLEKDSKSLSEVVEKENALSNLISQYRQSLSLVTGQLQSVRSGNCPTCGRPYEVSEETINQSNLLQSKQTSLTELITKYSGELEILKSQHSVLQEAVNVELSSINSTTYQINEAQRCLEDLSKQLNDVDSLNTQKTETEDKILGLNVVINEKSKLIDEEQEFIDCIGYLKRQLSRDFKGYMLEEVIKFMSSRAEYYSDYLFTTGTKIKVSLSGNKILISVGDRLYENLSGGERQRVDLAVQFALRDMLVTTSGFSCNLLVLDEAFDNLDAQGSDALVKLIVSEFSDVDSVFVVTHHAEIDIPYDYQITVVKDSDGVSSIR